MLDASTLCPWQVVHPLEMDIATIEILKIKLDTLLATPDTNGCIIYVGPTVKRKNIRYGRVNKVINGKSHQEYAHRVAKLYHMKVAEFEPGLTCSHLCHVSLCCNPRHINVEPQFINNQRINCKSEGRCLNVHEYPLGHKWPACILK